MTRSLLFLACAVLASACASYGSGDGGGARTARWARSDGVAVQQGEAQAALEACRSSETVRPGLTEQQGSVAFGVALVECMERRGYVLIPTR